MGPAKKRWKEGGCAAKGMKGKTFGQYKIREETSLTKRGPPNRDPSLLI